MLVLFGIGRKFLFRNVACRRKSAGRLTVIIIILNYYWSKVLQSYNMKGIVSVCVRALLRNLAEG